MVQDILEGKTLQLIHRISVPLNENGTFDVHECREVNERLSISLKSIEN